MGVQSVESGTVGVSHGYFFPQPGPFFSLFSWRDLLTQGNETGAAAICLHKTVHQQPHSIHKHTAVVCPGFL